MLNENFALFNMKLQSFGLNLLYFIFYPMIEFEKIKKRELLNSISRINKQLDNFKIDITKYIK